MMKLKIKTSLLAVTGAALVTLTTMGEVQAGSLGETVVAPFTGSQLAVTTSNTYSGLTNITVSGIGQAAGTSFSDAFYIFTDSEGNNISPFPANEFGLFINLQIASSLFAPGQEVPDFRADHIYSFIIDAPGGALTFGVGDLFTPDNTGAFTITLNGGVTSIPESSYPISILGFLGAGLICQLQGKSNRGQFSWEDGWGLIDFKETIAEDVAKILLALKKEINNDLQLQAVASQFEYPLIMEL